MEINKIINGDSLDFMKTLPDKCIDFVCADFPYNISNYWNSITKKWNNFVKWDFWEWDKWDNMEVFLDWVFEVCIELQRITKPLWSMVLFFDNRQAGWIAYELERRGILVYKWPLNLIKINPLPHLKKTWFRSSFEHWVWMINSQERYIWNANIVIKPKVFNFLEQEEMKNCMNYVIWIKETEHTTEKPLHIVERLIRIFTNEGDLVFDPFMWSWTTAKACINIKRNYLWCEIDKKHIEIINKRIKTANAPLFV